MQTFTGLADADGDVSLRIPLTGELINILFNQDSDRKCLAFAAVNVDPADAKTVAELRKLAISSTFDSRQIQAQFAMDGTLRRNSLPDIQVYFADPYASWQKGAVENMNGLIR